MKGINWIKDWNERRKQNKEQQKAQMEAYKNKINDLYESGNVKAAGIFQVVSDIEKNLAKDLGVKDNIYVLGKANNIASALVDLEYAEGKDKKEYLQKLMKIGCDYGISAAAYAKHKGWMDKESYNTIEKLFLDAAGYQTKEDAGKIEEDEKPVEDLNDIKEIDLKEIYKIPEKEKYEEDEAKRAIGFPNKYTPKKGEGSKNEEYTPVHLTTADDEIEVFKDEKYDLLDKGVPNIETKDFQEADIDSILESMSTEDKYHVSKKSVEDTIRKVSDYWEQGKEVEIGGMKVGEDLKTGVRNILNKSKGKATK